ncbi:MAG TPA: hypothetical protein VJT74_16885 [Pyrinomonadaceae bacterium]|nr:hypothetical protein [Pyrinomonadaceae bacterium]
MRHQFWISQARRLLPLLAVTALPVLFTTELWAEIWTGVRSQAWDGSGHQVLAQLYSATTFPDTFGWINNYFGGMPHPNFYPPLFYWLVALLDHTHLVSFVTAFKLVLALSTLLLPAATWALAWKVSGKNGLFAFCAALAVTPLLVDSRFFISSGPLGITYMSTFLTGLYTHPLGYLLLILWYAVYSDLDQTTGRVACSSLLMALALLSSLYGAGITGLLIASTAVYDFVRLRRATDPEGRRRMRRALIGHLVSPFIAVGLALFWLAPVLSAREYLVTQPSSVPFRELVPPAMWVWYAFAAAGIFLWLRRERSNDSLMWPYLATCVLLACAVFFSGLFAPRWLPIHPARFAATLNFMLALPVGWALAFVLHKAAAQLGITHAAGRKPARSSHPLHKIGTVFALLIFAIIFVTVVTPPSFRLAFYPTADGEKIDPILAFAREHRDGRYLVEIPPFSDAETAHEGRAINNYLGGQGNEVLTLFFREVSPSVIFMSPLVNTFSVQADPFGISSTLADDKDFAAQPVADHLKQARLMGVRYLVIRSPWSRNRLEGQGDIKARHDFGLWSVYELGSEPAGQVQAAAYKPALVVSGLNLKGRRQNVSDFVRLAEEQFSSTWYDVLLARSGETRLDHLDFDEGFGALVVDTYEYDDEDAAFNHLREFAERRTLILLAADSPLFQRVRNSLSDFPQAVVVERTADEPGAWLEPGAPTRSYGNTAIRKTWGEIRRILDERKVAVVAEGALTAQVGQEAIKIDSSVQPAGATPVLIRTTFHPNWRRADGKAVYPITPFFMLTFVREPVELVFARRAFDSAGLILSAVTLLLLTGFTLWTYRGRLTPAGRRLS